MKIQSTCIFLLLSAFVLTAETVTYKETVKGKTTEQTVSMTRITENGLDWEIAKGKDSTTKTGYSSDGKIQVIEVEIPEGKWTIKTEGDSLTANGSYKDKPINGTLSLNGRIWSSGFDFPLKWYAQKKLDGNLPFLMINITDMTKPTEMVLIREGEETIDGKKAIKFKITLDGAMSVFWSAKIWADPVTGEQLKYQGNKGPGTQTVVLLVERQP